MPTIKQLPIATSVQSGDLLPVSQGGTTRGLTIGNLLSSTQAALQIIPGKLLGRVSQTSGAPEPVGLGAGLSLVSGAVIATGADHLILPVAEGVSAGDEVLVNSGSVAKRMATTALRELFTAGPGVSIDANGAISSSGSSLPATPSTLGSIMVGTGLSISAAGTLTPNGSVVALRSDLSTVASSGAYQDLSGRPALGNAALANFGTVPGSVADGGLLANSLTALASAITIGGAPVLTAPAVAVIAASGNVRANWPILSAQINVVTVADAVAGVVLPARAQSMVVNRSLVQLSVYPPAGARIDGGAIDSAVQVAPGGSATFVTMDSTNFYAF